MGAVVDEEDGEDAVVDDGADEVGDAVHEGVEVEGGVERVGEALEEVDLQGLDADVGSRTGGGGAGDGAVVALEGMRSVGGAVGRRNDVAGWGGTARFGGIGHEVRRDSPALLLVVIKVALECQVLRPPLCGDAAKDRAAYLFVDGRAAYSGAVAGREV